MNTSMDVSGHHQLFKCAVPLYKKSLTLIKLREIAAREKMVSGQQIIQIKNGIPAALQCMHNLFSESVFLD